MTADCSVALPTWLSANHTSARIPVLRHHHVRRVASKIIDWTAIHCTGLSQSLIALYESGTALALDHLSVPVPRLPSGGHTAQHDRREHRGGVIFAVDAQGGG